MTTMMVGFSSFVAGGPLVLIALSTAYGTPLKTSFNLFTPLPLAVDAHRKDGWNEWVGRMDGWLGGTSEAVSRSKERASGMAGWRGLIPSRKSSRKARSCW